MKKLEGRAILCLLLAAMLIAGLMLFVYRLARDGDDWAAFYANQHIYSKGSLTVGKVVDRDGSLLLENDKDGSHYNDDATIRKATLHVTGDKGYNISTAANTALRARMVGYNFITGTNGFLIDNREIKLTIDADVNLAAYNALAGRNGFAACYNWKTGEIICCVSTPSADPTTITSDTVLPSGTYVNKVFSSTLTPGSTFKLVTTAAAIDNMEGLNQWTFECSGSYEIDGEKITCPKVHGKNDLYGALADSCNCAYAAMAVELGTDVMEKYVEKLGLTSSYNINGIETQAGSFEFDTYNINLGWAGIGQYNDLVNPLSMMVYMGAIAGDGNAAKPVIVKELKLKNSDSAVNGKVSLLNAGTARQLQDMMRNNVIKTYGDDNYPGLELHAKSGTAEVGEGKDTNAWFTGYSGDYAFVVCIEGGGYGSTQAGPVANAMLQAAIANEE